MTFGESPTNESYQKGFDEGQWAVTRVGVTVVLFNGKKILMGMRRSPGRSGDGQYQFPGGKVDWGETPEQACIRETLEETGADIYEPTLFAAISEVLDGEKRHFITLYYTAYYKGGLKLDEVTGLFLPPNEKERTKCDGWKWVEYDNLPQPMWTVAEHVKDYINLFGQLAVHLPR